MEEHQTDVEKHGKKQFTRATRQGSQSEVNKSVITDHVNQCNHVIDWKNTSILDKEQDRYKRRVREAIHIQRQGNVMNRDAGNYKLSNNYHSLITDGSSTHVIHQS